MKTAIEAITAIKSVATNKEPRDFRGAKCGRQGDVIVVYLAKKPKKVGSWDAPHDGRQVAVGATKGARHIAHGDVTVYRGDNDQINRLTAKVRSKKRGCQGGSRKNLPDVLIGPVVVPGPGGWTLKHPEHAEAIFDARPCVVIYQGASAEMMDRQYD